MLQLEEFVFGATVRLSFTVSPAASYLSFEGKLQRDGATYEMTNSIPEQGVVMLSSIDNPLPAGKYKFVLTSIITATGEPDEELEADLIIKPRK